MDDLIKKLEALEAPCRECDALREALELCLNELFAPEGSCSCHISPPCNDCVEYSSIREAIAAGRAALEARGLEIRSKNDD